MDLNEKAKRFHSQLSYEFTEYLRNERLIPDEISNALSLGQCGHRLSIPVTDAAGNIVDIRMHSPPKYRESKTPKVTGIKGGDGKPKLFPLIVKKLIQLKRHRDGSEPLDDMGILGPLEHLEPLYEKIKDWSTLLIVEGELDALAALSAGALAITNTCGAKSWDEKWGKEIADLGIDTVILMDADDPGRDGAETRGVSLYTCGISPKVAEWPKDAPVGHDVTDELRKNGFPGLTKVVSSAKKYSEVVCLADITAEEIRWIFSPYIPKGLPSMIEGEPGIGKSFLSLWIASQVSMGKGGCPASGVVLLLSAEDGLPQTVKPRLEKMGANLHRVIAPREIFTLDTKGFEILERLISDNVPELVIIDPLTPFLDAKKDSHKASDMRPFFKSLARLACHYDCAIVVTRHLAKSVDLKGVNKGLGSIDISAAVRSILQVSEDGGLKRVEHIKCNIGPKGKPFGYRLDNGIFSYVGSLEEKTADESQSEIEKASDFIRELLKKGPLPSEQAQEHSEQMGFSTSTIKRARRKVGVDAKKIGNEWYWWIPGYGEPPKPQWKQDQEDQESLWDEGENLTEESP